MKAPVYIVKPKNIFRHPFNKFDLDKPMNRDSQNDDITDFFNYGFNEDTMIIYGKLVKRTIQVLDESINSTYFDSPSELMRLNDQIPMDFGGFCKFFDTTIFANPEGTTDEYMINYHNGQRLFNFFIYIASQKNSPQYPLIDFVKCMYKNSVSDQLQMCDVMETIQQNLQRKYQQVMKKLVQKKNSPGGTANGGPGGPQNPNQDQLKQKKKETVASGSDFLKQIGKNIKKQQQDASKIQQQSSQSESSSNSDDQSKSSESQSQDQKRRKKNKKRSGRSKSDSRGKKDKNKNKKIKKQSKQRKNKDRKDRYKQKPDKKRKKSRQKQRQKDKERDKQRDRSRQRKDKNKKRRN